MTDAVTDAVTDASANQFLTFCLRAETFAVQEVITLNDVQIEPPPRMGVGIENELVTGMGKLGERFIILLNIERLFAQHSALPLAETPAAIDHAA